MRVSTRGSVTLLIVGLGGLLAFPAVGAGESRVAAQQRRVLHRRSLRRLITPQRTTEAAENKKTTERTEKTTETQSAQRTNTAVSSPVVTSRPTPTPAPSPAPSSPPPAPPAVTTPPRPPEEPSRPARAVELRFWYNRTALQARLERQRRVPAAAPQQRKVTPQPGDLVLQGEDHSGTVMWQRPISDPTILHVDTFTPATGALTPGGLRRVDTAPLWVYVPSDPAPARVTLFAPVEVDESGAQKPWKSLGSWRIEP